MSIFFTVHYFTFWYIICRNVKLLYVQLSHGHASCLPFARYTVLLSGTLYGGTSNCFMSTFFTDMRLVFLFHIIRFYILEHYMQERLIALCLFITRTCLLSTFFTVYYFTFWYTIRRNVKLLYVYLFHGHASCLSFSRYTILFSGTLYVGTSNCLMSTYLTDMLLVYPFHGILFYFLVHYM